MFGFGKGKPSQDTAESLLNGKSYEDLIKPHRNRWPLWILAGTTFFSGLMLFSHYTKAPEFQTFDRTEVTAENDQEEPERAPVKKYTILENAAFKAFQNATANVKADVPGTQPDMMPIEEAQNNSGAEISADEVAVDISPLVAEYSGTNVTAVAEAEEEPQQEGLQIFAFEPGQPTAGTAENNVEAEPFLDVGGDYAAPLDVAVDDTEYQDTPEVPIVFADASDSMEMDIATDASNEADYGVSYGYAGTGPESAVALVYSFGQLVVSDAAPNDTDIMVDTPAKAETTDDGFPSVVSYMEGEIGGMTFYFNQNSSQYDDAQDEALEAFADEYVGEQVSTSFTLQCTRSSDETAGMAQKRCNEYRIKLASMDFNIENIDVLVDDAVEGGEAPDALHRAVTLTAYNYTMS